MDAEPLGDERARRPRLVADVLCPADGQLRADHARAGHSEHQLGTAIDVTSEGGVAPWNYGDWADTAAGSWMAANAWRYGFVMSYPRGGIDRTCYDYEPWHYRYVGRSLAAEITANGRTPREVIWTKQ